MIPLPKNIPEITETEDLNRHLCVDVHSSIIHNRQTLWGGKNSLLRMSGSNVVYPYNGMLLSLEKEGNPDT